MQNTERTFIMVKPDGVQRQLIGKIVQTFEKKGLRLAEMKFLHASADLIRETYSDETSMPYFPLLLKIMTSGPVVPMVWTGTDAVGVGRRAISQLVTQDALPGTIRGNYCLHVGRNVCHGADSVEEAEKDIKLWFPEIYF